MTLELCEQGGLKKRKARIEEEMKRGDWKRALKKKKKKERRKH